MLALALGVVVGGLPGGLLQAPVAHASEPTPQLKHAATNGKIIVGADQEGRLWWSEGQGASGTWVNSGSALSKNGVTSLVWTGSQFIASSFFSTARSTDGKSWLVRVFPLGQAFDPGNIISDADFFRAGSMSVEQIQAFLDNRLPSCQSGYVCINKYTEDTWDRDKTVLCDAYDGERGETVAEIIHKVSAACGVAAEVLIVLIQKEQGLVTLSNPTKSRYDRATGYACPDTAPCDAQYFGFYNQVYNAAKQFKRYANPPGTSRFFTWYPVGQTSNVGYHPNRACGAMPVRIQNQATAGLYYYTPYTPNQAAMANLTGLGDTCSAYGNRNFWRLYNYWFNPTKDFGTYITTDAQGLVAVDGDGVIARSQNGADWLRIGQIPGVGGSKRIAEFGFTESGSFGIVTIDGQGLQSTDLRTWSALEVTKSDQPQTFVTTHTVKSGDTVWAIARANGVTASAVVSENKLAGDGSQIYIGQKLTITKTGVVSTYVSPIKPHPSAVSLASLGVAPTTPTPAPEQPATEQPAPEQPTTPPTDTPTTDDPQAPTTDQPTTPTPTPDPATRVLQPLVTQTSTTDVVYVVKRGDTVLRIAARNKTTVAKIRDWNKLRNVNLIRVGQRLIVGQKTEEQGFHRVEAGDTVTLIAQLRGTTVPKVLALNPNLQQNQTLETGLLVRVR